MPEPESYDLWLLCVDGDDKARVAAIGSLLRVDVRAAQHIVAHLPRLLARDLRPGPARKVAEQLKRLGGVAQLCPAGQSPRLDEAEPARAPAPARPEARKGPRESDALVEAARTAQDAAMAHWPARPGACAWHASSDERPPPVPAPVRHSAGRVVLLLTGSLLLIGASASAYWARFGDEMLAVTIAKPAAAVSAAAKAPPGTGDELARALVEHAQAEDFRSLVVQLEKALGSASALHVDGHEVGVTFEVLANLAPFKLDELYATTRSAGATLFVAQHAIRVGMDRLALVPTSDSFALLHLFRTSGPSLETAQVEAWLRALHATQSLRVLGVGPRFVEGRFEVPTLDQEALSKAIYDCPGLPRAAPPTAVGGADGVAALATKQRGELFSCNWD